MTPEQLLAELPPSKLATLSDEELVNNFLNDLIPATRAPFAAVKEETLILTTTGERVTLQSIEKQQQKNHAAVQAAMEMLNKKIATLK